MATLKPYIPRDIKTGSEVDIKLKVLKIWKNVGDGKVTKSDDYDFSFSGMIDYHIKGPIEISVTLDDHNPNSKEGPCTINRLKILDGQPLEDVKCHYNVDGQKLVIAGDLSPVLSSNQKIEIYQTDDGIIHKKKVPEFDLDPPKDVKVASITISITIHVADLRLRPK